jgi:ATP-dependent Lhr-like helicase
MKADVLELFHPAVARWFRESFAEPTPPQRLGWPRIAAGENTLILAPTGSGKTLAAFLYAIDELVSRPIEADSARGVHTLYVSPLKALANDIERNLEIPLAGVRRTAQAMGLQLDEITVGLRTGDTPAAERRRMATRPPRLLITTPESLHLLMTSPRSREILRSVRYVIVDEIHSLVPDKRGTFLALLLERLEALASHPPTRIGLSATQRPLDLVASFLGGLREDGMPRPVSIVDGGMRKDIDLRVESSVEDMTTLPAMEGAGPTIWPSVHERLLDMIETHGSTLVFANNRRLVERIASELNGLAGERLVRAHHGSVSKEQRLEIERELKAGRLPGLVATSSLELGIDVGAIDLVCQVETPTSVASALQRVGRSGHLYRATSKGRMIPKTRDDLLRMAAMARAMRHGWISAVRAPENALDVLAQQIVAMVAVEPWDCDALYERIRRAYPYRGLPREAFDRVVDLVSGRFRSPTISALRPRVAWDRARNVLEALPGSRQAVLMNGGTIPDTGQYAMVLEDGKTKLGELDEEFVFERRLGQTILLGTSRWRILEIGVDRVVVAPSDEGEAVMPFWKGEGLGQDVEFGRGLGEMIRLCEDRAGSTDFESWIAEECLLDPWAARNLATYIRDQIDRGKALPSDRTVFLDAFRGENGDPRLAILTPFGRAFHLALLLAFQGALRASGGPAPQAVFSNAGIVVRVGGAALDDFVSAFRSLRAESVQARIVEELESTPYFALCFRRNAARALLLPRARPGRRTPLWLQRLRSHDLLEYARDVDGFPMVAETYREILEDRLPLQALRDLLAGVEAGEVQVVVRRDERPSPFSASLLLDFTTGYFYDEDEPAPPAGDRRGRSGVAELLEGAPGAIPPDPQALRTLEERLQSLAPFERARDGVELVDLLRRIGDLTAQEMPPRCEEAARAALGTLIEDGRIVRVRLPGDPADERLVAGEDAAQYRRFLPEDATAIVRRYVANHAGLTRGEIERRYPGSESALDGILASGDLVEIPWEDGSVRILDPEVLAASRRITLAKRRRAIRPVTASRYVDALLRRHHMVTRVSGEDGLREVLDQLCGWFAPVEAWSAILSARVGDYRADWLESEVRRGAVIWRGRGEGQGTRLVAFAPPGIVERLEAPGDETPDPLATDVLEELSSHGALYLHQVAASLDRPPSDVAQALWSLSWAGRVTNDSLAPAWGGRPTPEWWRGRKRAAWGGGRWSKLADGVETPSGAASTDDVEEILRILLHRHGVLSRELIDRESLGLRWRDVYPILSRMDWRGEAQRGLFVEGLSGPQFCAGGFDADLRNEPRGSGSPILVSAVDPAALWGEVFPIVRADGERHVVRRHAGNHLVLRAGRPILAIETTAERLTPLVALDADERAEALACLPSLVRGFGRPSALRIRTWDERPVGETPVATELERLGFMREDPLLILYRTFGEGQS